MLPSCSDLGEIDVPTEPQLMDQLQNDLKTMVHGGELLVQFATALLVLGRNPPQKLLQVPHLTLEYLQNVPDLQVLDDVEAFVRHRPGNELLPTLLVGLAR